MKTFLALAMILNFSSAASASQINVTVKGMVCAFCAQGITKKFKAQPEIESVEVSLEKKIVALKTKETQDISDERVNKILTASGYNVDKIERPK